MNCLKLAWVLIPLGLAAFLGFWPDPPAPEPRRDFSARSSSENPLDEEFRLHQVDGGDAQHARLIAAAARCLFAERVRFRDDDLERSAKSVDIDPDSGAITVMFRNEWDSQSNDYNFSQILIHVVGLSPDLSCRYTGAAEFDAPRR